MIRGKFEKDMNLLGCVTGSLNEDGTFAIRDKNSLELYAKINTKVKGHVQIFIGTYEIKDPIRRTVLLDSLQKYANTPLRKR